MVVGTQCPTISGLTFVQGEPFSLPRKDGPTVLELWSMSCGPCLQSIPHLTALQKKHEKHGLRIAGVTSDSDVDRVKRFVSGKGQEMAYTVACDTGGATFELQQRAGVRGIPHSFVMDRAGTIVFSGHPMSPEFEQKLASVAQKPQEAIPPITQSLEELKAMSIKALKGMLDERGISTAGAFEKGELAQLLRDKAANVTYYR